MSARKLFYQAGQRVAATLSGDNTATPAQSTQPGGADASIIFLDGILCSALRSGDLRPAFLVS